MSKPFEWFSNTDAKAPALSDIIREGRAKVEELRASVAAVVVEAADQVPGAAERYKAAKEKLATVQSEVDLLRAAQAEHEARAAKQAQERRRVAHAERVEEIKADLLASHKHAADLRKHLAAACEAYDKLLATRRAAMDHGIKLPDYSEVQIGQTRAAVADEVFRVGTILNSVAVSQHGFPGPVCEIGALSGRPETIETITDGLARVDAYRLAQLEGQRP